MFLMKIKFFGQMKYKYVIEEVNKRNKALKWVAMISSEIGLFLTILITGVILMLIYEIVVVLIVMGLLGLFGLGILIFSFVRMFPRIEKMAYYKTGGFLREHVNTSTVVLLILFFIFPYLAAFFQLLFLPLIISLPYTAFLFITFSIEMLFLGLLWFITVPFGLKLPNGKGTFKQFSSSIGLNKIKPLWKNILIGIFATIILLLSALFLGIWLGTYEFDPNVLFGPPNPLLPGFLSFGWFRLIYMLRPGIWEEVAFRGVILNLQKKKFKPWAVILINGIIFGLFHFVNLLSFPYPLDVSLQVIYAACIGIALSYMYIKTKSLLPCIITHYLLDAFIVLFTPYTFPNLINNILYQIVGVGVLPAILVILMVYIIFRKKNSRL
jgi:membrane protease YdiL (CAAX protease family)